MITHIIYTLVHTQITRPLTYHQPTHSLTHPLICTLACAHSTAASRDALAKFIYAANFDWLIKRVNQSIGKGTRAVHSIGILDIFGFEIFEQVRACVLCHASRILCILVCVLLFVLMNYSHAGWYIFI